MLSHASRSVVNLGLQEGESTGAVRFRDDQSIPPLPARRSPQGQGQGGGEVPPVPPIPPVPALLPAFDEPRVKPMPSRTSLRKKASQVFELSKASIANLRAAALGGGGERDKDRGGGLAAIEGSPAGATESTPRLPLSGGLGDRDTIAADGILQKEKEARSGRPRAESRARFGQLAGLGSVPVTAEGRERREERRVKLRRPGSSNV
ncbi:hypothetical protein BD310DRAFT_938761 [Dichomitus squalens]|uniref:Uncharacterized protein n=1 Tax=Dichomitus squalens TaxID=114155 RepID=A0A4Q9PEG8_9APHY|nr:hypothetical protein BD310DRAFT_938761 [Dichomitus squalens]